MFQILVRGGDDPDADLDGVHAANALNVTFLQYAQDLGLGGGSHVSDLIEKNGATIALFKLAQPLRRGAGERTPLVAEELTLDQILGDGGAVDRHIRFGGPVAVPVQAAGDQLLAGAALAGDHDRGVAGGELADDLENLLHGGRGTDNALLVLLGVDDGLVAGGGLAVGLGAQGALDQRQELRRVKGFHHVVVGPKLHRLDGGLGRAECGHENDQLLRVGRADVLEGLQPRHAGHAVVEQDDVGRLLLDRRHAFLPVGRLLHLVMLRGEHAVERIPHLIVIIDDQNAWNGEWLGHD